MAVLPNDVLPFYRNLDLPVKAILTDNGREFCGTDRHPYELYLDLNGIEHGRTKAKSPKTNGFVERVNGTVLYEFFRVNPVALVESLIAALEQAGLARGASGPLLDKLTGALAKITDGSTTNDDAATSLLDDFIGILVAKAGKQVPQDLADVWTEEATRIIELLSASAG